MYNKTVHKKKESEKKRHNGGKQLHPEAKAAAPA